jgi:hypothetical protein
MHIVRSILSRDYFVALVQLKSAERDGFRGG